MVAAAAIGHFAPTVSVTSPAPAPAPQEKAADANHAAFAFYLVAHELNDFLVKNDIDGEVLPIGSDKLWVCGPGITRPLAARLMGTKDEMTELSLGGVTEVEFHRGCDVSDTDNYRPDGFLADYPVAAATTANQPISKPQSKPMHHSGTDGGADGVNP
jgi:hypothetical protein